MEFYGGTVKIKNPKTLRKWIKRGWYQKEIEAGYSFYPGCGRFRTEPCTCYKCRGNRGAELRAVIDELNSEENEITTGDKG